MTIPESNLVISIRFRKTEETKVADRLRRHHCTVPKERPWSSGKTVSSILFDSHDYLHTI